MFRFAFCKPEIFKNIVSAPGIQPANVLKKKFLCWSPTILGLAVAVTCLFAGNLRAIGQGKGTVHLEGIFIYGNHQVRFIGDIDLATLTGNGHLVKE
jgi:hypothetical protein